MEKNVSKMHKNRHYEKIRGGLENGLVRIFLPSGLEEMDGEVAALFIELRREEYVAVSDRGFAPDGTYRISQTKIAEATGLSVSKVIRCLDKLSDRSTTGQRGDGYSLIHVRRRGPHMWRIAVNDFEPGPWTLIGPR